jgi:hypothetical protein
LQKKTNLIDKRLPFPTRTVRIRCGPVEVYEIPESKKAAVLKKLYPFKPRPDLEDIMEDIHAEKTFKVKDFMVTREGNMNILASPYYLEAGGTVIDWYPLDADDPDATVSS